MVTRWRPNHVAHRSTNAETTISATLWEAVWWRATTQAAARGCVGALKADWNGSGMHANFSNTILRTCGSKETYDKICEAFRPVIKEHIEVYGAYNDQRLTGDHETQSIDEFSYGVSDRGASIRIPIMTVEKGWKGWLEDRRPASNADPYKIAARIIKTVKSADV